MPKYIVHKTKDYTVMGNTHFREKQMTLRAKGLLSLMLSLPDDWDYSIAGLCTLSKDGRDSVMNALKELESFGYLVRTKTTDEKGHFSGYDYNVYEEPQTGKPFTETPCSENPNTGKPNTENPQELNTNILNTKSTKTSIEINTNIKDIVCFLNQQADCRYKADTPKTVSLIKARMAEGFTVEDFKTVINHMVAEWKGTDMEKFLRPETLFGTKFESYLNRKPKQNNSQPAQKQEWGYDFLKGVTVIR